MCTSPFLRVISPFRLEPWERSFSVLHNGGRYVFRRQAVESILAAGDPAGKYQIIPCGQCIECRLTRKSEWTDRIVAEASRYTVGSVWMLTLTYRPGEEPGGMFLTLDPDVIDRDAIVEVAGVLDKRPLSDWIKRFRERVRMRFGVTIRFFACGEYGSRGLRAHYHVIVFGLPVPVEELVVYRRSSVGCVYRWPWLEDCWTFGFSTVVAFCPDVAGYVAGYVAKKITGRARDAYEERCSGRFRPLPQEFVLMSRRPGIGADYLDTVIDSVRSTGRVSVNGHTRYPGRYYDLRLSRAEGFVEGAVRRAFKARRHVEVRSASERARAEAMLRRKLDHYARTGLDDV